MERTFGKNANNPWTQSMASHDQVADPDGARRILTPEEIHRVQPASEPLSDVIVRARMNCALEKERIDACSFMVATQSGPISMCLHNVKRDEFILALLRIPDLIGYINRYRTDPIPENFMVRFLDYDWTVNARRATTER